MLAAAARNKIKKDAMRSTYYLKTELRKGGRSVVSQKRGYLTSLARVPKNQLGAILNNPKVNSLKHNMVMIADLAQASESIFTSTELVAALENFNIGHSQMTFIISADQWHAQRKKEYLQRYLTEQVNRRGPFGTVLVVGGSAIKGMRSTELDENFAEICDIVSRSRQKLGLILNPYQRFQDFLDETKRKSDFRPACYYSQPLFNPHLLPDPIRIYLEEMMKLGEIELTVGMLQTDARMYQTQSMVSIHDKRVNPYGMDKYLLPAQITGGTGLEHVNKVLDWLSLFHRNPGKAVYTRYGVSHDATPLIQMLQGTRWDMRQFMPPDNAKKPSAQIEEVD